MNHPRALISARIGKSLADMKGWTKGVDPDEGLSLVKTKAGHTCLVVCRVIYSQKKIRIWTIIRYPRINSLKCTEYKEMVKQLQKSIHTLPSATKSE